MADPPTPHLRHLLSVCLSVSPSVNDLVLPTKLFVDFS
jgi:hypothetical protein